MYDVSLHGPHPHTPRVPTHDLTMQKSIGTIVNRSRQEPPPTPAPDWNVVRFLPPQMSFRKKYNSRNQRRRSSTFNNSTETRMLVQEAAVVVIQARVRGVLHSKRCVCKTITLVFSISQTSCRHPDRSLVSEFIRPRDSTHPWKRTAVTADVDVTSYLLQCHKPGWPERWCTYRGMQHWCRTPGDKS